MRTTGELDRFVASPGATATVAPATDRGLGRGNPCDTPVPMIVEALPDSNTATYTVEPSELTSMALGRFPSMTRFVTTCKVEVLKTWTRFGWPQDTYARAGVPAKTMSDGSFEVTSVFTTRAVPRSTMLMESER